ncbi:MAG: glycolate oxidase subunit GlcF [Halofilum sp. (in: g-proteobacteria)]|nr:glycolate oxidase subunit GlcF [Halofilum sp. (in: g-proteobacteria)]
MYPDLWRDAANPAPFMNSQDTAPRPGGRRASCASCTHCGFCLAQLPDLPPARRRARQPARPHLPGQATARGRGADARQTHLDRCLTCRACETTCPSGVEYGRLADLGRELVEERVAARPDASGRAARPAARACCRDRRLFATLLRWGGPSRPLVPRVLHRHHVPRGRPPAWPQTPRLRRRCAASCCSRAACSRPWCPRSMPTPARVLTELGIEVVRVPAGGCCGAIDQHLGYPERARARMRHNLDAWQPALDAGADAIVINATGCGAQVAEYAHALADDPDYAERAQRATELATDPVELLEPYAERLRPADGVPRRIAFHAPCTLQHGLGLSGRTEALLRRIGFELTLVGDPHICCGSAGTYSVLQPGLARELRDDKVRQLERGGPQLIATANVGCLTHIQNGTRRPVRHWLELVTATPAQG